MDHVILYIKDISVFIPRIHTRTLIFFHFAPYVLFVISLGKGTKTFVAKHKIASFAWSFALSALWKHNMAYYSGPHKKTPAQDDTLSTDPTAVDWQLPEFWCGSLAKPIRGAFFNTVSFYSATFSGTDFYIIRCPPAAPGWRGAPVASKGFSHWDISHYPCGDFSGHIESWGAGFPRLELSHFQWYANSATCPGLCSLEPLTKCKPGRKSIIFQCTCSEIKLDHLQQPVSSAMGFPWL